MDSEAVSVIANISLGSTFQLIMAAEDNDSIFTTEGYHSIPSVEVCKPITLSESHHQKLQVVFTVNPWDGTSGEVAHSDVIVPMVVNACSPVDVFKLDLSALVNQYSLCGCVQSSHQYVPNFSLIDNPMNWNCTSGF